MSLSNEISIIFYSNIELLTMMKLNLKSKLWSKNKLIQYIGYEMKQNTCTLHCVGFIFVRTQLYIKIVNINNSIIISSSCIENLQLMIYIQGDSWVWNGSTYFVTCSSVNIRPLSYLNENWVRWCPRRLCIFLSANFKVSRCTFN